MTPKRETGGTAVIVAFLGLTFVVLTAFLASVMADQARVSQSMKSLQETLAARAAEQVQLSVNPANSVLCIATLGHPVNVKMVAYKLADNSLKFERASIYVDKYKSVSVTSTNLPYSTKVGVITELGNVFWTEVQTGAPTPPSPGAWWDNSWQYRRLITGLNPSDNQVFITLEWENIRPNELRFLESENENLLTFYIENYTSSSVSVWVQRIGAADNSIYVYYGNPSAQSASLAWSGKIILGAKLVPPGWAEETSFENRFPRGSETFGVTGGSETHTHTYSGTTSQAGEYGMYYRYAQEGAGLHTHGISGTTSAATSIPLYFDVVFVSKANFLPRKVNENFVMLMTFLPSDWTAVGETGRYVRGGAVFGSMGGSASHVHTASGTTGGPSDRVRISIGPNFNTYIATETHTHTYSFTTSSAPNTPSYLNVITASPNANVDLVPGTLAFFDNLPPLGWEALSLANGRLFRIDSYYGATGGGPHTHTASGTTSNESAQYQLYAVDDYAYAARSPHSHSFSIQTDPAEALPPYITVRVARRISQVSVPTVWGQEVRP
jgi:hypothetical protein